MSDPTDVNWITYGQDYSVADRYPVATGIAVVTLLGALGFGISYAVSSSATRRAARKFIRRLAK